MVKGGIFRSEDCKTPVIISRSKRTRRLLRGGQHPAILPGRLAKKKLIESFADHPFAISRVAGRQLSRSPADVLGDEAAAPEKLKV